MFQSEDMLHLYDMLDKSKPIYAYKLYAYKKRVYFKLCMPIYRVSIHIKQLAEE